MAFFKFSLIFVYFKSKEINCYSIEDEIMTCKAVWVTDTGQTFLLATWDHRNHIIINYL